MEGSPVLCAKLLLGIGGTEPQNAAFFLNYNAIQMGFILFQTIGDGSVLLPGW